MTHELMTSPFRALQSFHNMSPFTRSSYQKSKNNIIRIDIITITIIIFWMKQQRSYFVRCYRSRINVRDGLQHVQLLRRRDHLHEETLRTRHSQRRVPVQAHWTTVQLCPAPRARLWIQRQHVPQFVSGQVSIDTCNPGHPVHGVEMVRDMISIDRCSLQPV